MAHLWSSNTPAQFWRLQPDPLPEAWTAAVTAAAPVLGLPTGARDLDTLLALSLGEGQFGPDHWRLSWARRWYYRLKPLLPRQLTRPLRRIAGRRDRQAFPLGWPVEDHYARFLWAVLHNVLRESGQQEVSFIHFWPHGRQFALVLTHDIETAAGQSFAGAIADLDEQNGFRSLFNFVPERYPLDCGLIDDLRARGFEIGVHGLTHDGRLFSSRAEFDRRAVRINRYLDAFGAHGFRSPCTLRHPDWMQDLAIDYDLSFFDTDPYEPISGGVMTIWPFRMGRFLELPYTLAQDFTLVTLLGQRTPELWQLKVAFIREFGGMALANTHPDYLRSPATWDVYARFLADMREQGGWWHALPCEVARWWNDRTTASSVHDLPGAVLRCASLDGDSLAISAALS
ncbi:MAG: hypothetical protein GX573_27635 [Chloroflexi bacterium]|nr:hypothetical protein [Chloroflexota bacterium]